MPKSAVYRLRIKTLENRLKKPTSKTDRAVMARKLTALIAMADSEDWLDGKPSQ